MNILPLLAALSAALLLLAQPAHAGRKLRSMVAERLHTAIAAPPPPTQLVKDGAFCKVAVLKPNKGFFSVPLGGMGACILRCAQQDKANKFATYSLGNQMCGCAKDSCDKAEFQVAEPKSRIFQFDSSALQGGEACDNFCGTACPDSIKNTVCGKAGNSKEKGGALYPCTILQNGNSCEGLTPVTGKPWYCDVQPNVPGCK